MEYEQTCFFSGHRRLPDDPRLLPALEDAIRRASGAGCRRFLCGGALGFDTLAAQTLLRLRKQQNLRLCLVLPCRVQERACSQADQETYWEILRQADEWEFLQGDYTPGCMLRRNRVMASRSGRGLFLWDGRKSGGTAYTLRYFRLLGETRPVLWENLWPPR
ncbi:MAG: DUF1273 domain-containing protein [Angelakisella sp.]|nr:DUF1273 domain-containing protein [Angelakisella sp.]